MCIMFLPSPEPYLALLINLFFGATGGAIITHRKIRLELERLAVGLSALFVPCLPMSVQYERMPNV